MAFTTRLKTRYLGGAALAFALTAGGAVAFEPIKPIDFTIMAGTGGGADQMARFMQGAVEQNSLSPRPLVPTNRPGGSGAESFVHLINTGDPDYSIMVTLNSFYTTPLRQPGLNADIMEFTPIARMAEDTFLLWVHRDEGITTFEEFVEAARERGQGWTMSGTGQDQEDSLLTDWLNTEFDLDILYIPMGGGGEVAAQVAGRQVNSSVNNPSEALGFYQSGDLIPLVAFTDERLEQFPDVPTIRELGTDFSYYMQRSVVGAPGMSDEARDFYANLFQQLFETEEWQGYMDTQSLTGEFMTGDELVAYWEEQKARHETMLRDAGMLN